MGMMKVDIPHGHGADEARARVAALFRYWSNYGVQCTWEGPSAAIKGKIMGITMDGRFTVGDRQISGEVTDPGFLLRGQAQKYVMKKFTEYLDPGITLAQAETMANERSA